MVDRKAHMKVLVMRWPLPFSLAEPVLWPVERAQSYSLYADLVYPLKQRRPGYKIFMTIFPPFPKRGLVVKWCYNSMEAMFLHLLVDIEAMPRYKK